MSFAFQPCSLSAASSLQDETKRVIAAFERCLATSDMTSLSALRSSIERRIDELDVFYHENLVDERSLLFGKQRSKLRKLLNEYAAAVAAHSSSGSAQGSAVGLGMEDSRVSQGGMGGSGGGVFGGAGSSSGGGGAVGAYLQGAPVSNITIKPDQRLSYEHLSWWFAQEGARELPGMDQAIVERVWGHTTRTNLDGKMSVSDLKGWYISFGKRALARNPPLTAADLEKELVPTAFMYDSRGSVNERVERAQAERERLEALRMEKLKEIGRAEAARARPATAPSASASASASASSAFYILPSNAAPLALPSDAFDFQLRLTEEEYRSLRLRQRELLAMSKFKERVEAAAEARKGRGAGEGEELGVYSKSEGAFLDAGKRTAYLYRS